MLKRAILYQDQLQQKYIESLDNLDNKYYHLDGWSKYKINIVDSDWDVLQYVSVDNSDNIIGYLEAGCDRTIHSISYLAYINFTNHINYTFSKDCKEFFNYIFKVKKFNKINWVVAVGNPAEKIYDKLIQKYNGRIVGTYYKDFVTYDNEICDKKSYELFREEYLKVEGDR